MSFPAHSTMRRVRPSLLAITVALLSPTLASQAEPLPAGPPPMTAPSSSPVS